MQALTRLSVQELMEQRGYSRRDFLKFCAFMSATLGVHSTGLKSIVEAMESKPRPPVALLTRATKDREMTDTFKNIEDPFRRLVAIMEQLLGPDGCPWDREQTHESLIPYLIEEAHEVKQDVMAGEMKNVCGELGDVALQVVFHAALAQREGHFDIDDVLDTTRFQS